MTRARSALVVGACLAVFIALGSYAWNHPVHPPTTTTTTTSSRSACTSRGGLPDPTCTPGALNPSVTQATIGKTICVRGWTATVRPPTSYTNPLKLKLMAKYGDGTDTSQVELDHLVPLELGGAPSSVLNLWPEPWNGPTGAHTKDQTENRLKADVCAGRTLLSAAQHAIATDWTKS